MINYPWLFFFEILRELYFMQFILPDSPMVPAMRSDSPMAPDSPIVQQNVIPGENKVRNSNSKTLTRFSKLEPENPRGSLRKERESERVQLLCTIIENVKETRLDRTDSSSAGVRSDKNVVRPLDQTNCDSEEDLETAGERTELCDTKDKNTRKKPIEQDGIDEVIRAELLKKAEPLKKRKPIVFLGEIKARSETDMISMKKPSVDYKKPISAREPSRLNRMSIQRSLKEDEAFQRNMLVRWKRSRAAKMRSRTARKVGDFLVKVLEGKEFVDPEKLDVKMEELKLRQIQKFRPGVKKPEKMKCGRLCREESPGAFNIENSIRSNPNLLENIFERISIAYDALNDNRKIRKKEIAQETISLFEKLLQTRMGSEIINNPLQSFLTIYEESAKDSDLNKIMQITIAGKKMSEAEELLATLHKWNNYSPLDAFLDLHKINWMEVLRSTICNQRYAWSDKENSDKISNIKPGEIVKAYLNRECNMPVMIDGISINDERIDFGRLQGDIKQRQFTLFDLIIKAIYAKGFSTKVKGETLDSQIKRLIEWQDPVVVDDLEKNSRKIEKKVVIKPKVWKTLPYQGFLAMGTMNALLMFRETLSRLLPGLFSNKMKIRAKIDKGIYLHLNIVKEAQRDDRGILSKEHSATQFINVTIYPRLFPNEEREGLDLEKPLGAFSIEWTVLFKEVLRDETCLQMEKKEKRLEIKKEKKDYRIKHDSVKLSEGHFTIVDISFTEYADLETRRQIMLEFFRLQNFCASLNPLDSDEEKI